MDKINDLSDWLTIEFRRPSHLTYHCTFLYNIGGLGIFKITGIGDNAIEAFSDAVFVLENRENLDESKKHQFNKNLY